MFDLPRDNDLMTCLVIFGPITNGEAMQPIDAVTELQPEDLSSSVDDPKPVHI